MVVLPLTVKAGLVYQQVGWLADTSLPLLPLMSCRHGPDENLHSLLHVADYHQRSWAGASGDVNLQTVGKRGIS